MAKVDYLRTDTLLSKKKSIQPYLNFFMKIYFYHLIYLSLNVITPNYIYLFKCDQSFML